MGQVCRIGSTPLVAVLAVVACGNAPAASRSSAAPAVAQFSVRSAQTKGAAWVHDGKLTGPAGPVPAYLVVPSSSGSHAGLLYFHGFGSGYDRSEFLDEAVAKAQQGYVSLLPQGTFPWSVKPQGDNRDVQAIDAERGMLEAAINVLQAQAGVDPGRIGFVGHDYGGMHGAVFAAAHSGLRAVALMTISPHWRSWFTQYLGVKTEQAAQPGYASALASRDAAGLVASIRAPLLLQFGDADVYVPAGDRDELVRAVPVATVQTYGGAPHELNAVARSDRDAWLTGQLRPA